MVMRFVIGQTLDQTKETELAAESKQYGGFMRLSLQVNWLACVCLFANAFLDVNLQTLLISFLLLLLLLLLLCYRCC